MPDAGPSATAGAALVAGTVFVFHDGTASQRASVLSARSQTVPEDLEVKIVERRLEPGDWAARNRAVGRARGTYIAVIDGGSTPDPDWLAASIAYLRDDPTLGIVSAEFSDEPTGDVDRLAIEPATALFVARRTMWKQIGGFDEAVSARAQGLSLGWRCWLMGWRAALSGQGGTVRNASPLPDRELEHLAATLLQNPGSLGSEEPGGRFSLGRSRRTQLQRKRRRPDGEIGALLARAAERGGAAAELRSVLDAGGVGSVLDRRRSIVVATADTLAPTMAGPGIRAWQIASALAEEHDVHLVTTGRCDLNGTAFPVESVEDDRFAELVDRADVLLFQGWVMADRPWLMESDVVIVADVYDPMHLEQLEHGRDAPAEGGRWDAIDGATRTLNQQLRRGDFFLCASLKQRDLWLGQLAAVGRVNQVTYDEDNAFLDRMRIVPFGIEDAEPTAARRAIRDAHPEIGQNDEVILWGGGIYNWFDPLTLIRAVDGLRGRRPSVKLYFLGTRHPNPEIPEMRMAAAARELADELGLLDTHVFFNDGWVPYAERADYLLDADIAVSIHRAHIETEFSFRTRLLDYLWCGLPIVATAGDSFEPLIEEHHLGLVVPPGDVTALEHALETLLSDPDRLAAASANARKLADEFRWDRVLEPVRDICRNPTRAPDVACPDTSSTLGLKGPPPVWREDLTLARRYFAEGGVSLVARRLRSRVERLRSQPD